MAHILLVDDNPHLLSLYSALLRDAGHEVETATNGREAVDRMNQSGKPIPTLVLLDMEMPEMDGVEAALMLGDNQSRDAFQVIALTSHELPEQVDQALDAGCDGYITKPTRADQLITQLSFVFEEE